MRFGFGYVEGQGALRDIWVGIGPVIAWPLFALAIILDGMALHRSRHGGEDLPTARARLVHPSR